MITRNFILHLTAGLASPLVINVNQYDQGEQWLFTLYNQDGTQYVPSSGAIVGIKSDNLGIINSGTVDSQGRVVINETQQMTAAVGKAVFELVIDDGTHGTANFVVLVEPKPGNNADLSETDISMIEEAIEAASSIKPYGSPLVASTVADMTDHEKVYVYVGSETGYTSGHWYYYDGDSWEDGGVYNSVAVQTDTTLTLSGVAADAKKTGDEINDLKSEIINSMPHAVKVALDTILQNVAFKNDDVYTDELTTFHAWATAVNLLSITAVFDQGQNAIHENDSLDVLRQYLTVTAFFDDGTSGPVSNYELSGTLAEGTSIITVNYEGETASFNVTVTSGIVYQLLNTTFTGDTSEKISTGLTPLDTDSDYTVAIDLMRDGNATADSYVFQCMEGVSPYYGFKMQVARKSNVLRYALISNGITYDNMDFSPTTVGLLKVVIRHKAGDTYSVWSIISTGGVDIDYTVGSSVKAINASLFVGGNGFIGVVNSLTWYNYKFTDAQKNAFLGVSE